MSFVFKFFVSYVIKWYCFGKMEAPEDGRAMFATYSISTYKIMYWNSIQGLVFYGD